MLTRYILRIDGEDYVLREDDLRNWGDVKCSRGRSDYGSVTRSFTSQFEFVNEARRMLLGHYLANRFGSSASLAVETMTNSWTYERRFECHLDFSTVQWDDCVLRINAVDDGLAAVIKAAKGIKYEYVTGEDIAPDASVRFDRIPMVESATYEFTQGETNEDNADIVITFVKNVQPWVGNVGSEIAVNRSVYFTDDQEDDSSGFLLRAEKDTDITFDYELEWSTKASVSANTTLGLRIRRDGELLPISDTETGGFCVLSVKPYGLFTTASSASSLPDANDVPSGQRDTAYALVGNTVYTLHYNRQGYEWMDTGKDVDNAFIAGKTGRMTVHMKKGDHLVMIHSLGDADSVGVTIKKSLFRFSWEGIGDPVDIDALAPATVASALLRSMTGRSDLIVKMSGHDVRLKDTYIMAAESIRGIDGARLYTSFSEFCDWMSAVFGYVFRIGGTEGIPFTEVRECGGYSTNPYSFVNTHITQNVTTDDIFYFPVHSRFLARKASNGNYYAQWPDWQDYNDSDGFARSDVLFRIKGFNPDVLCRFDPYDGSPRYPIVTPYTEESLDDEFQIVEFLHRSELFDAEASVRPISECADVKYGVDSSAIYSSVTAGYDKKDYNSINGRDEFNFSNTYSTGCSVTDKSLSLISKYRADSYGIEFAAQKRGLDTTDSESDKDTFFVHAAMTLGQLRPTRTIPIEHTASGRLFNAVFSPMACVRANAGLIGLQADEMTLAFTSSTGNSDAVIGGDPMTADIFLDTPFATCGTLEFETYEAIDGIDEERLISVMSGGIEYRGFLKEADTCYAREETTACKLIVKEVWP